MCTLKIHLLLLIISLILHLSIRTMFSYILHTEVILRLKHSIIVVTKNFSISLKTTTQVPSLNYKMWMKPNRIAMMALVFLLSIIKIFHQHSLEELIFQIAKEISYFHILKIIIFNNLKNLYWCALMMFILLLLHLQWHWILKNLRRPMRLRCLTQYFKNTGSIKKTVYFLS